MLVDAISQRHADRFGTILKCRKDYPENNVWPHLGFESQNEVPGRGKKRLPLSVWWKDHGHPDLFSTAESIGLLRVALDLNVFLDLESHSDREGSDESRALTDDWLADQIEFVVTPELRRELSLSADGPDKMRQQRAVQRYWRLSAETGAADAAAQHIIDHVAKTQGIDLSIDRGDRSGVRHVAEAALAGVTVLATRDEHLLRWSASALDVCGIRVMRPADVVLHVDELARAQAYSPAQLQDTEYRLVPVRSGAETELLTFLNGNDGEHKPQYLARVRSNLAEGRRWSRMILRSPEGEPIAFYVVGTHDKELLVPFFRIRAKRLENTIARQLLFRIRQQALHEGRQVVRITDPCLVKDTALAIRENGFIHHDDNWIGLVIRACGSATAVDAAASDAAQTVNLHMQALRPGLSAIVAADLERTLWPAKIIDSELPTYLVPINPAWSAELFGIPQILMPRSNNLGISREHVYYRAPQPRTEQAPARLVWYVMRGGQGGIAAVIGCSRLDELITDKAPALHQRFRHLGVWSRDQVARTAHGGKALALRFAATEIFPRHVYLPRLNHLAANFGQTLSLRSPQRISTELFAAIYQEGHSDR